MEELIQRIVNATGLDPQVAQQAVGIILGFIKKHAPDGPMGELLNSIPGGDEAIADNSGGGGGLMGALGGMLGGGAGGMMAVAGQLQSKGLDMSQMKSVGQEIFKFGEEQIGSDKIKEIAANIPGLSSMV